MTGLVISRRRDDAGGDRANGNAVLGPSDFVAADGCVEATVVALLQKGVDSATIIEALNRAIVALARGR